MKKLTQEKFLLKALQVNKHQGKYDYSRVKYIDSYTKVNIVCLVCKNDFWQTPGKHIYSMQGCPDCSDTKLKTQEQFIKDAKNVHKNKYDYSQAIYVNAHTYMNIICPIHGIFKQIPAHHTNRKQGCPDCSGTKLKTQEQFIQQATIKYLNKYDYSQVQYINIDTCVNIICPIHGSFQQTPYIHLKSKIGCSLCADKLTADKNRKTLTDFINESKIVHGNKYDYSNVNYINFATKVKIKCNKCNFIFEQPPASHIIGGYGCLICNNKWKNSMAIQYLFKNNEILCTFEQPISKINIQETRHLRLDIYFPDLNIGIEYDGAQHYYPIRFGNMSKEEADKAFLKTQERDQYKNQFCQNNNIELIRIDGRKYKSQKLLDMIEQYILPYITEQSAEIKQEKKQQLQQLKGIKLI